MPFDIALSGLNAASADLETISNNIANSSTHGFKKSRAEFADVYASATNNAIGRGVRLAAVTQQFGQGSLSITENPLDLGISGDGFFRLNDNGSTVYSRAGAFGVDRDGFIVNTQQQRLTGFLADTQGTLTGAIGDLRVDTADLPPRVTTLIDVGANLDASQTVPVNPFNVNDPLSYNHSTSTTIYDSLGSAHIATMYYSKSASNQWQARLFVDGSEVNQPGGDALAFANDGSLFQINGGAGTTTTSISFNPGTGAAAMTLTMDYADLTQYGSPFGVNALSQDGFAIGRLSDVGVDELGMLSARYSNGQTRVLGQVVLSNFANPQGLRQLGDTNWAETFSSGAALTAAQGSGDLGLVQSGALEQANVDLTEELVNMITAQRNFQANAQVISTADQITQTIINIR